MVPADLWTHSQHRDPWKFFDLLILHGGFSDLHNWYSSSQSRALYYGGHHYGEWHGYNFDEELPELIEPNTGDWQGHISKLLSTPVERLKTSIREEIRACTTRDDANVQANRIQAQLNEYRERLAKTQNVPCIDEIDSAILSLGDYLNSRLQFFEVLGITGTDHDERDPELSETEGDAPRRGRTRDSYTSPEMLAPLLRKMLANPKDKYRHRAGRRKGKPNVSRIANDLMKDHPNTCGEHSFETMQRRVKEAINANDDMS